MHHIIVIPWLAMCYSEVEVDPCDKHVRLQSDLVDRWRWQGYGQCYHTQERWRSLTAM